MARQRRPGDVIELPLPRGDYVYGRVYRDACVGFYQQTSDTPSSPPGGDTPYAFVVGVHDSVFAVGRIVAFRPFGDEASAWPPPMSVPDPITGRWSVYHKGLMRSSTAEEAQGLEPAAVWDYDHLVERFSREAK